MVPAFRFLLFLFIPSTLGTINPVYADCNGSPDVLQLTPLQERSVNCMDTAPGTKEREKCCAQLYPNEPTAAFLCVRRTKLNSDDANKLHESFTNAGPQGGQTDRLPIIFLPGIAGTALNHDSFELWPTAKVGNRLNLELKEDGKTSATGASISLGQIFRNPPVDFYGGFLKALTGLGYQDDVDLFTFAYDWRCTNNSHYGTLDRKINEVLTRTGKQKVILIAHSMGGLIARGYIYSDAARAGRVDRLIAMGTPYWGAPKPWYAMIHGYTFDNPFVNESLMKVLTQNWPAGYQLMPRIPFVSTVAGQKLPLSETNAIKYKGFTGRTAGVIDSYAVTPTNEHSMNSKLVEMANDFYSKVGPKERPAPLPGGVRQYDIIGRNISTLGFYEVQDWTPGKLDFFWPSSYLELNGKKVVLRPVSTDGDGTVPRWSAETAAATRRYYIAYKTDWNVDFEVSSAHSALPSNKDVQYIVLRILQNSPPEESEFPLPPAGYMGAENPPEKELESLSQYMLNSDAHLRISNSSGKVLGYNSKGAIEETLYGTFLDMDETEYASVADISASYTVEVVGIRDGKFTLDVRVKNPKPYTFSYQEVPVKPGTVASFTYTPAHLPPVPEMTVTTDGQTTRVSPKNGPASASNNPTNISVPGDRAEFSRELNTTFTGNTPILRYYVLKDAIPDQCKADCSKDSACAAYTYVKPGGYKAGDPPVCYLFSGLGPKVASNCCVSGTRNRQDQPPTFQACDYPMTDPIYRKWMELGSAEGKLGCPISGERECGPSINNTTCRLIQFKKDDGGYLLQHTSGSLAGKVFDVSGCMFKIYYQLNGPKSWLGLPTSDGYVTPTGSREDFESGYILWDSKTYVCTAYRAETSPPQQTQADVTTPPIPNNCALAGSWTQQSESTGTSTWIITADGQATESGLGRARGTATLSGRKLRIDFRTDDGNYSGYYEWNLDSSCNSGSGYLIFTSGATGSRNSTVKR